jgi:hypothetical protein
MNQFHEICKDNGPGKIAVSGFDGPSTAARRGPGDSSTLIGFSKIRIQVAPHYYADMVDGSLGGRDVRTGRSFPGQNERPFFFSRAKFAIL